MKDPIRTIALISTLLLMLLFASAAAVSYPLTVTDELGRRVVLERPPQRIVAMIPSLTEAVCALRACDLLVGVDQFSNFPEQVVELPKLGSGFSPNVEEIVALQPDLVLVDEDSGIASQLEAVGLTVFAGTGQTYDEVFENFALLGTLLDRETEAAVLSGRVRGQIEAVAAVVADLPEPTVFYELDATPYSVGPASFIGVLIAKAGGRNIVTEDMGEFPQVDPEYIVASDPEVIVLADAPFGETALTVAARPGWNEIAAVADGRVAELSGEQADALSRPGPRMGEAVLILAGIFHPGSF
ncbi:MAG: ABC transporter substrate-binding protein [Trueperaceae bacterium]